MYTVGINLDFRTTSNRWICFPIWPNTKDDENSAHSDMFWKQYNILPLVRE